VKVIFRLQISTVYQFMQKPQIYSTNLMSSAKDEHRTWAKWSESLVHTRKLWRLQQPIFFWRFFG